MSAIAMSDCGLASINRPVSLDLLPGAVWGRVEVDGNWFNVKVLRRDVIATGHYSEFEPCCWSNIKAAPGADPFTV